MSEQLYEGRYVVIGPPGTGKTTFLSRQVGEVVKRFYAARPADWDSPCVVCSLTKAAAAEVAGRDVPLERDAVGTLHSHCYRLIGRPRLVTRDDVRVFNVNHQLQLAPEKFPSPRRKDGALDEAVGMAAEESRILTGEMSRGQRIFDRLEIHRHRKVPRERWTDEEREMCDYWEAFKEEREVVDFTDLIERALMTTTAAPGRPWVILVDEAQDLSTIEFELVKRWGEAASATILVGDPLQTIYGFRGSDPRVLDDPSVPATHRRVLSQSYRVPARVLAASVHWVRTELGREPDEYKPKRDPFEPEKWYDGWVEVAEHYYRNPRSLVNEVIDRLEEKPDETIMIQASCSYMLNPVLGELRLQGIPFSNPWKANHGNWNAIRQGENTTPAKVADALTVCSDSPRIAPWSYVTVGRLLTTLKATGVVQRRPGKSKVLATCKAYESHPDATPSLAELEEWFGEDGYLVRAWRGDFTEREFMDWWWNHRKSGVSEAQAQFLRYVVQRYGSDGLRRAPQVYVGTCHSFKGAEAGVVYVFPDISPQAYTNWARRGTEERDEIVREFYVAMTRSQEGLVVCRNSSTRCVPLRREVLQFMQGER